MTIKNLEPYPNFENMRDFYRATKTVVEDLEKEYERGIQILSCTYVKAPGSFSSTSHTYEDDLKSRKVYAGISVVLCVYGVGKIELGSKRNATSDEFQFWKRNFSDVHGSFVDDPFKYLEKVLKENTAREKNKRIIKNRYRKLSDKDLKIVAEQVEKLSKK